MRKKKWVANVIEVAKGFRIPEDVVEEVINKVDNSPRPIPLYYKHAVSACKYDRAIRLLRPYMAV